METVLIVDDDPAICEAIQLYLETAGINALMARDGREMRATLDRTQVDLVILDLKLPGEDGFALTRHLRATSNVAIIIITGNEEEVDRVVGLELGADDYVAKPFSPRELLARIKTILRRTMAMTAVPSKYKTDLRYFSGWQFDTVSRNLIAPGGEEVSLTTQEYNLLAVFTDHPNDVFDRDRLSMALQNRKWDPFDRSVDVLVGRLRAKIEDDPKNPQLIKTVRSIGYIFTPGMVETLDQRDVA